MAVGITECGEGSAGIAIGIREVAEPRVQQRVAKDAGAVLAVAFVQRKHALIIARFPVGVIAESIAEEVEYPKTTSATVAARRGMPGTGEAACVFGNLVILVWPALV